MQSTRCGMHACAFTPDTDKAQTILSCSLKSLSNHTNTNCMQPTSFGEFFSLPRERETKISANKALYDYLIAM